MYKRKNRQTRSLCYRQHVRHTVLHAGDQSLILETTEVSTCVFFNFLLTGAERDTPEELSLLRCSLCGWWLSCVGELMMAVRLNLGSNQKASFLSPELNDLLSHSRGLF